MSTFAAVVVEAVKDGLRQTQNGQWKLTIALHPSDDMGWLLNAPMGQRLGLTIAALHDRIAESSSEGQQSKSGDAQRDPPGVGASSANSKRKFHELPLSQQCALRCADKAFQQWVGAMNEHDTADWVRLICNVESRSEMDTNDHKATAWRVLDNQFLTETSRVTESRG